MTPQQPTLAEIVAGLREEAKAMGRIKAVIDGELIKDSQLEKSEAIFTLAADRLEALAKLANQVMLDRFDEMTVVDHESVYDWFDARDRLLK